MLGGNDIDMDAKNFLKKLSNAVGISGREHSAAKIVCKMFEGLVDEVKFDALGSVIMFKKGKGSKANPKIMLAAHVDEIGLIVTGVDKGFIRFSSVGGVDQRILPAMEVVVHGKKELIGVISSLPPHLCEPQDKGKAWKFEELFVDCGISEEELSQLVQVGDVISFKTEVSELLNSKLSGKSMDNRAGLTVLYECAKRLSKADNECDVYFVATVLEEVSYGGAITSTFGIMPDIGIAVDVTHANAPELPEYKVIEMGKGPGIGIGPHVHPKVYEKMCEVAEEGHIPYQVEPSASPQGTDAFAMQTTGCGVATGLLSVPLRYMHTPAELLCVSDVVKTGKLLAHFVMSIDSRFMEELKCC